MRLVVFARHTCKSLQIWVLGCFGGLCLPLFFWQIAGFYTSEDFPVLLATPPPPPLLLLIALHSNV